MHIFWWVLGILLAAVWLHRLLDAALGVRTIPDIARPEWDAAPGPRLTVIVPARNEEEHVEAGVRSLLALDYSDLEIIAVNDRSTDRTGEVLDRLAVEAGSRLRVLHIGELPAGWLGKNYAMYTAARQATGEWLLFTDADVVFRPDALRRAVHYAEREAADHLVVFPTHRMETAGERMMLAFFGVLFTFGHRPWKVADPRSRDHMGLGAFNLLRRRVYEAIGTHQAIRMAVIDDMKLGELVKRHGFAQRNVFGAGLLTLRWARGAMGVVENLTKNMFALMQYRWPRTLGAVALLLLLHAGPFLGLAIAPGFARLPFAAAVTAITAMYAGMWLRGGVPFYYVLLHPLGALLWAYTLLRSMFHALREGGVVWRGTKYPLEELRRDVV